MGERQKKTYTIDKIDFFFAFLTFTYTEKSFMFERVGT